MESKSPLYRLHQVNKDIEEYLVGGDIYVPEVVNLTCSYKISILGIFLTELQVVDAIIKHFDLRFYRTQDVMHDDLLESNTIHDVLKYMKQLFPQDKKFFSLNVKRYSVDLLFNSNTLEYTMPIPEYFGVDEMLSEYWDVDIDEVHTAFDVPESHDVESNTLYIQLVFDNFIPAKRYYETYDTAITESHGGTKTCRLGGLFATKEELVNAMIVSELGAMIEIVAQEDEEFGDAYHNQEFASDLDTLDIIKSYHFTLEDLNRLLYKYGIGRFVVQTYPVHIQNHRLPIPLDLTEQVLEQTHMVLGSKNL